MSDFVSFNDIDLGQVEVDSDLLSAPSTLPREIADGIVWMGNCQPWPPGVNLVHGHYSSFLILGATATLLVDTGPPAAWGTLSEGLATHLAGRPLDFVMPTHPEIPHAGNLRRVLEAYPEAVAIGDARDYVVFFPDLADRFRDTPVAVSFDLGGGYRFEMLDGLIKDLPNTRWGYEASQKVLFVADGFSFMHDSPVHRPDQCGQVILAASEHFPRLEQIVEFSSLALYWSRYRDDSKELFERLSLFMADHPVSVIAPAHGNVIVDLEHVIPLVEQAHKETYVKTQERLTPRA